MNRGTLTSLRLNIAAVLVLFCGTLNVLAQAAKQHARVSLVSDKASITPGNSQWIGLSFELEPGWHIYWTNPGDSGEPPKVSWHLPEGIQAGNLQFPAPQRIPDHGLMDYGYQGRVILLSKLTVPASVTSKKADIGADVRYLVCREVCVPGKEHVALTLSGAESTKASPDSTLIRTAMANLPQPLPQDLKVSVVSNRDSFVLTVSTKDKNLSPVSDFFPAEPQKIDNAARPTIERSAGVTRLHLKKSEQFKQPESPLRGLLIAGNKAYAVTIPVTASKNSSADSSSRKTVSRRTQAPTSN